MTTKKLRILVLSFWTPPALRPQAILIGKMVPEWIRQGVEPIIVTYDVCGTWQINTPLFTIPQEYAVPAKLSGVFGVRTIFEYLYYRNMTARIADIAKKNDVDAIFSFANPQASNIIGARVAHKTGLPFISHFSDPWIDNPYSSFPKFSAWKIRRQEKSFVAQSAATIFTNQLAQALVMKKYREEIRKRSFVIPHCFEPSEYPIVQKDPNIYVISHIGAFYTERNPTPLFAALQEVFAREPHLKNKTEIRLIGGANPYTGFSEEKIRALARQFDLENIVSIRKPVPYAESLRLMKESDLLVTIDANFSPSPFLPSKAVDYAGSGVAQIGITPKESATTTFLRDLGCPAFGYEEKEKLTECLSQVLNGKRITMNETFRASLSVAETTKKLLGVIRATI